MNFKFIKKTAILAIFGLIVISSSLNAAHGDKVPAAEPFEGKVLTDGLNFPWEMVWRPDKQIWVTERAGRGICTNCPSNL